VLKAVEAQLVVSLRIQTAPSCIPSLFEDLDLYLKHRGITTVATLPHFVLWHGCEECDDDVDLEVACPIPSSLQQSLARNERLRVQILPAMQTASILHCCQTQSICCASVALADWIEANGYLMVAGLPRREVYLTRADDGSYVSDVQIPVMDGNGRFA
jgi:effector-binding domain-containing protein